MSLTPMGDLGIALKS